MDNVFKSFLIIADKADSVDKRIKCYRDELKKEIQLVISNNSVREIKIIMNEFKIYFEDDLAYGEAERIRDLLEVDYSDSLGYIMKIDMSKSRNIRVQTIFNLVKTHIEAIDVMNLIHRMLQKFFQRALQIEEDDVQTGYNNRDGILQIRIYTTGRRKLIQNLLPNTPFRTTTRGYIIEVS